MKMTNVLQVMQKIKHIDETRRELHDMRINGRFSAADDETAGMAVDLLSEYIDVLKAIKVAE